MAERNGAVGRSPAVRVAGDPADDACETTAAAARSAADTVPVVRTGPTGGRPEPLVLATADGRTAFYHAPDQSTVADLVATLEDGPVPTDRADAVVDHDSGTRSLPVPDSGPLSVGRRALLGPCGWVDPTAPADCEFVSTDRDAGAVADVGIRGRGRGDATTNDPVGDAWATVRATDGDPVVVLNCHDADRRQRADRTLLAGATVAVLDALAAVASHLDAADAVVYLNEADDALRAQVSEAVDAASDHLPAVPQVATGPDEYRAGAPTVALEALEGNDRLEPRLQPPSPAAHGLYGRPTAVHTVRTVLQVRHALRRPEAVDPDHHDPGTRLFTVSGDVAAPATVELPSEGSLAATTEAVAFDGPFKMACVGGILGGFTRDVDLAPTARSLAAAGLGTEGVVELFDEDRCPLADAGERVRFAADANSGRCVPGREGTQQLAALLRDVYDGSLESDKIRELGRVMRRSSNCRIGAHAPRPVTTAMDAFEPEFRAHADGRCPAGVCTEDR